MYINNSLFNRLHCFYTPKNAVGFSKLVKNFTIVFSKSDTEQYKWVVRKQPMYSGLNEKQNLSS